MIEHDLAAVVELLPPLEGDAEGPPRIEPGKGDGVRPVAQAGRLAFLGLGLLIETGQFGLDLDLLDRLTGLVGDPSGDIELLLGNRCCHLALPGTWGRRPISRQPIGLENTSFAAGNTTCLPMWFAFSV